MAALKMAKDKGGPIPALMFPLRKEAIVRLCVALSLVIAAEVLVIAALSARATSVGASGGPTPRKPKETVSDRMAYKTVVEDYPGGSTWREYADGSLQYITVGGN